MIKLVWRHRHVVTRSETPAGSADVSAVASGTSDVNLTDSTAIEKVPVVTDRERANTRPTSNTKSRWRWNWRLTPKADEPQSPDPEKDGAGKTEPRPIRLYAPFYCGLAVALSLCRTFSVCFLGSPFCFLVFVGSGIAVLLAEWVLDSNYSRFSLVVTTPFLFSVALVGHSNFDMAIHSSC